jgi:hypothetical protein
MEYPDLQPWFDNPSDEYHELVCVEEFPYDE